MPLKRKRVRTRTKVILAVTIPIYIALLAVCVLGVNIHKSVQILPDASIDGVDISWLTIDEAIRELDVQSYDERGKNARVAVMFPDGSELKITGKEVGLEHNARFLINEAYSLGRGQGFLLDTVGFLQRIYNAYILKNTAGNYKVG